MMEDHDAFDTDTWRIDPADPTLRPKAARPKKQWQRRFIKFPWEWMDRLKATKSGVTYRLALLLAYEHWRTGGRPVVLSNIFVEREGISSRSKWRALQDLERLGVIAVERGARRSPRIKLLGLATET
jgi:heme A synthase